jgi:hypothetical protein
MEENLRGFLVHFYFEHYEEHFTNVSKYWKFQANRFWKQFWFYGVNSKGTKHIMSVSKLHSIHVELQKFEGTTLIHAPHTCSSKHFVISMSLSIHKSKTNTIVLQEKCFCKKIHIVSLMHTIGSLIEHYFLYEIIIFVGQKADES